MKHWSQEEKEAAVAALLAANSLCDMIFSLGKPLTKDLIHALTLRLATVCGWRDVSEDDGKKMSPGTNKHTDDIMSAIVKQMQDAGILGDEIGEKEDGCKTWQH
jgi:hypothetical protein